MSATNHTTNYELPVFIGTDKPAWLVDWNGAMNAIDTAIKQAETKADQAGTDVGSIQSDIIIINSSLNTLNNAVSQLRIDTNANTGAINTIQELIGNGTPTTTDHTLIGAINEINAKVYDFDLTAHNDITVTSAITGVSVDAKTDMKVLLNNAQSAGKVYGNVYLNLSSAAAAAGMAIVTVNVPGLAVSTPFVVKGYELVAVTSASRNPVFAELYFRNGAVDIRFTGDAVSTAMTVIYGTFCPCLLFLKDLGD